MAAAHPKRFDTIVVGAGSAGAIVAARLSEDPAREVLLLEAGRSDRTAFCKTPGMISIVHTVPQVKRMFDWGFKIEPRQATLGRKMPYFRGKVVGGSSAINGMVFVRGHRATYDAWAEGGCAGWGFEELLPFFKRLESFEDGESELRGGSGPVQVTRAAGDVSPTCLAFKEAVAAVAEVPELDDYNGATQEGVAMCQINARGGRRYSTSEAYLEPGRARPNLTVRSGVLVHEVLVEGGRARGVRVEVDGAVEDIPCEGEVVLSAGAVGSPQILLRSGVGPAAQLRALGLEVAADLPVGEHLQDHLFVPMTFLAPEAGHRGTPWHFFGGMLMQKLRPTNWFGRSVFEVLAFLRTEAGLPMPDLQLHVLPWAYPSPNQDRASEVRPEVDTRPALTILPTLVQPRSTGRLALRSVDPHAAPEIDPGFLTDGRDLDHLVRGVQLCREIVGSPAMRGVTGELHPGAGFFEEAALRAELPNRVQTVYHPVGTCRMGVGEDAVVDLELRVRGIEGLRVADASIMPSIPNGNTNAACMMIGERAAALLGA